MKLQLFTEIRGRPIYTKGPVLITLEFVQLLTGLLALTALVIAIFNGSSLYNDVQHERYEASLNTCYAIRHITLAAYTPKYKVKAQAALSEAGLSDCVGNALKIIGSNSTHSRRR